MSSIVFFAVQYYGKIFTSNQIDKRIEDQSADNFKVLLTFVISFIGTAFAEICSVPFYYPYDIIKVRMQTMQSQYGYVNFIDACCKIWNEKPVKSKTDIVKQLFRKTPSAPMLLHRLGKIRNFYHGGFYYTLAYTAFISLEFAIHDMIIEWTHKQTGSKDKSIFTQFKNDLVDKLQDYPAAMPFLQVICSTQGY